MNQFSTNNHFLSSLHNIIGSMSIKLKTYYQFVLSIVKERERGGGRNGGREKRKMGREREGGGRERERGAGEREGGGRERGEEGGRERERGEREGAERERERGEGREKEGRERERGGLECRLSMHLTRDRGREREKRIRIDKKHNSNSPRMFSIEDQYGQMRSYHDN